MQREEVIVEHSQLMAIAAGDGGNYRNVNTQSGGNNAIGEGVDGGRGGGLRPHHYTQVRTPNRLNLNYKKVIWM